MAKRRYDTYIECQDECGALWIVRHEKRPANDRNNVHLNIQFKHFTTDHIYTCGFLWWDGFCVYVYTKCTMSECHWCYTTITQHTSGVETKYWICKHSAIIAVQLGCRQFHAKQWFAPNTPHIFHCKQWKMDVVSTKANTLFWSSERKQNLAQSFTTNGKRR